MSGRRPGLPARPMAPPSGYGATPARDRRRTRIAVGGCRPVSLAPTRPWQRPAGPGRRPVARCPSVALWCGASHPCAMPGNRLLPGAPGRTPGSTPAARRACSRYQCIAPLKPPRGAPFRASRPRSVPPIRRAGLPTTAGRSRARAREHARRAAGVPRYQCIARLNPPRGAPFRASRPRSVPPIRRAGLPTTARRSRARAREHARRAAGVCPMPRHRAFDPDFG
jgi:hypothetical protein